MKSMRATVDLLALSEKVKFTKRACRISGYMSLVGITL